MQGKRTVLITGGARGIGRQLALDFGAAGYNVIVNYNKSKDLALELVNELNAREIACQAVQADVSSAADVERMKKEIAFGPVDTLINNAGIAHMGLLQYDTEQDFDRYDSPFFRAHYQYQLVLGGARLEHRNYLLRGKGGRKRLD